MNSTASKDPQKRSPVFFLIIITLIILAVALTNAYYKKTNKNPNQEVIQSALVLEQQFILTQTDAINTNWLRTLNPLVKNVEGRVVWSNILQKGVMEFIGLPKIDKNQKYRLWIYDLIGKDSKPIFATEFSSVLSDTFLISFSTKEQIKSPFKFELMLKTEGEEISQPLFLAQP